MRKTKQGTFVLVAILAVTALCIPSVLFASDATGSSRDVQPTVWFQGFLADAVTGDPINAPSYFISAEMYDSESGGSLLWGPETHSGVVVTEGWFHIELGGAPEPVDLPDFTTAPYWLQLTIQGETLIPRQKLASTPSALAWNGGPVKSDSYFESTVYVTDAKYLCLAEDAKLILHDDVTANPEYHERFFLWKDRLAFQDPETWDTTLELNGDYHPSIKLDSRDGAAVSLSAIIDARLRLDPASGDGYAILECDDDDGGGGCLTLDGPYPYVFDSNSSHFQLFNSRGEKTIEIDLETGNIYYAGELHRME